jgi:hypothetical protein
MKTVFIALLLAVSFNVFSDEELPKASKDVINQFIELCKQYAEQDEVDKNERKQYMLECVNAELEENGYQKIDKLD